MRAPVRRCFRQRELLLRRVLVTLCGDPAWRSTAEDVILPKLIWNRITPSERQLGDAAGVLAVQAEASDKSCLRPWAKEPGVASELERLTSGDIKPKNT